MNVSIVIVNYNTNILLKQCINSIYQHTTDIYFEIIVIDNASNDGSIEMIKSKFPNVLLIESKKNLGFGKANNIGAKHAKGKYLFLLNSDTELIENSIKILFDFFENTNKFKLGAVGCNLVNKKLEPQISFGNFPSIKQELFEYGFHKIFKTYYNRRLSVGIICQGNRDQSVDYISGANILIPKVIFDDINGFDEDFFLYYEETEMCFRLKKEEYSIICNPNTTIIHIEGASGNNSLFNHHRLNQYFKSKYLYYKKCHGKFIAIIVKYISIPKILIINRAHDWMKILKMLLETGEDKKQ